MFSLLTEFSVGVRHVRALAVIAAELPAVERAFEALALDDAADRQVGAHVRAVRVDDVRLSVVAVPEHRQVQTYNGSDRHL